MNMIMFLSLIVLGNNKIIILLTANIDLFHDIPVDREGIHIILIVEQLQERGAQFFLGPACCLLLIQAQAVMSIHALKQRGL